ncbi:MAG: hypothetical protein A2Z47_15120 [Thermodesulfovibrio sp. RBG_19FT_COMBO_42_12]|nr:MAG: hypothetical protein A2Z47_15120 [Thermodesulfovibrio sp. RBG_19FT_COMBO_42_12]
MRGDLVLVIVRTYGDRPEIRRIWDMDENAIYITNDEQFKLLTSGVEGKVSLLAFQDKMYLNIIRC